MPVKSWRIYYGDGSTYQGPHGDAPPLGVQVIAWDHPEHGRQAVRLQGYYWWESDEEGWYGGDHIGALFYLIDRGVATLDSRITDFSIAELTGAGILLGRSIPTDEHNVIVQRALVERW